MIRDALIWVRNAILLVLCFWLAFVLVVGGRYVVAILLALSALARWLRGAT